MTSSMAVMARIFRKHLKEVEAWLAEQANVEVLSMDYGEMMKAPERRVEEIDRLIGLELGADDYICKPFSPREVVARVKAVLRRVHPEPDAKRLTAGPINLNEETHQVTIFNQELNLTPSEFGLLKVMMTHPGRVFSRNELINKVQGYDFEGYDRTIDTHVKNLRKKIDSRLPGQEIISTVYGVGYKFSEPSP